jgi:hypothetical protein
VSPALDDAGMERVLRETLGEEDGAQPLPLDESTRRSMVLAMERAHWHASGRPAPWRAGLGGLALVLAAVLTVLWFSGLDPLGLAHLSGPAAASPTADATRPWPVLLLPLALAITGLLLLPSRRTASTPDVAPRGPS